MTAAMLSSSVSSVMRRLGERRYRTLQPSDWIQAGIEALAENGVESVRVETLAKRLGVSKGSFYWHFRDRAALLEAIVDDWERRTIRIIEHVETTVASGPQLLRQLFDTVTEVTIPAHRAIHALHAWAAKDQAVAARVQRVEQLRIDYMTRVFELCGLTRGEAAWRAELANLLYIGWVDQAGRSPELGPQPSPFTERLVALLLNTLPSPEA